jgi:uncharacterized lipoprotein YmbA
MKLLLAILAVGLAGCTTPRPYVPTANAPATMEELRAARRQFDLCMVREAERLDDGQSDAATVGRALATVCGPEWTNLYATLTQDMPYDTPMAVRIRHERELRSETALKTALELRRLKNR